MMVLGAIQVLVMAATAWSMTFDADQVIDMPCPAGTTRYLDNDGSADAAGKTWGRYITRCKRESDGVFVRETAWQKLEGQGQSKRYITSLREKAGGGGEALAQYRKFYEGLSAGERRRHPTPDAALAAGLKLVTLPSQGGTTVQNPVQTVEIGDFESNGTLIVLGNNGKEASRITGETIQGRLTQRVAYPQGLIVESNFSGERPFRFHRNCKDTTSGRTISFDMTATGRSVELKVWFGTKNVFTRHYEGWTGMESESENEIFERVLDNASFEMPLLQESSFVICSKARGPSSTESVDDVISSIHRVGKDLASRAEDSRQVKQVGPSSNEAGSAQDAAGSSRPADARSVQ